VENKILPPEINHFRIGEAAFFGVTPLTNEKFKNLNTDTFEFTANIIELDEKKIVPDGIISDASIGHTADFDPSQIHKTSNKAILDFGILDVDKEDIDSLDKEISFVGNTSDMLVVDLGENKTKRGTQKYHIGDKMRFTPNYMGVARLLNSKFIEKIFV
jgi:predicted amino acid racemase